MWPNCVHEGTEKKGEQRKKCEENGGGGVIRVGVRPVTWPSREDAHNMDRRILQVVTVRADSPSYGGILSNLSWQASCPAILSTSR